MLGAYIDRPDNQLDKDSLACFFLFLRLGATEIHVSNIELDLSESFTAGIERCCHVPEKFLSK